MVSPQVASFVGAIAAVASTASFAPQAWRIIRTRDTKSISLYGYLLTVAAFTLWLSYGALKGDLAIMAPNAICLALAGFILLMKALPQRQKEELAEAMSPKESSDDKEPPSR